MVRYNPFNPGSPINPGMFVGRAWETEMIEQALVQTRTGSPKSFLVTGERGIGKTSLLWYLKALATGAVGQEDVASNFLVVETDIDRSTTQFGLVRKIETSLHRSLGVSEPARKVLRDVWSFVRHIEAAGIRISDTNPPPDVDVMLDNFAYSLAQTANRVCEGAGDGVFTSRYDGVAILIDEVDNAAPELDLGAFVKLLLERLQRYDCPHVLLAMAGLPRARDVLRDSHPSSLRLFDELKLDRLARKEISSVVELSLLAANSINEQKTKMDPKGHEMLVSFSEGYPHFIQQFGYSAFAADSDGVISEADVLDGAIGPHGALDAIGDRYFRDDFYNKIQKDSYRQVLRIMADQLDRWVTKKEIKAAFNGSDSILNNAIQALRSRNIILSKEGERGVYRLQQKAFALWIKMYTELKP